MSKRYPPPFRRGLLLALVFLVAFPLLANAQAQDQLLPEESYRTPPAAIAEEVLAPRHENVTLNNGNPGNELFLNTLEHGLPPLAYRARPHYNLGGLQIDPQANRTRRMSTETTVGLEFIDPEDGQARSIDTPDDARISTTRWSPDGSKVAYFAHFDDATHLYVADTNTGQSTRLTQEPVLATLNTSFEWSGDNRYVFTVLVPQNRGAEPAKPDVPPEPIVVQTSTEENRLRTYPSLLENRHEAELVEYYTTGQLARIDVNSGQATPIGEPAMIRNIDAAPSGEHLRVQTMQKPFSFIVPVSRFSWKEEIWDLQGEALALLRESEVRAGVPDADDVEDFNRSNIQWRPDGQGLSLILEPEEDEEDGEEEESNEEEENQTHRVMQWLPPFGEDDMQVVYEAENGMQSVAYSDDAEILFITERRRGNEHVYAVFLDDPEETYTIYEHDRDDFYDNPGSLMRTDGSLGQRVVRLSPDRSHVFLSGTQYYEDFEEEAPRPFLDRVEIRTGEKERIFQSDEDVYESVLAVLDDDVSELMLQRQSPTMYPDSWRHNVQTGEQTRLTNNQDYNEAVSQAQRDRFKVERSDGFEFWVEVVMPQDWNGEPLPGFIWHYPREYDDQEDYNESVRRHNKNSYPRVGTRTADILVKHGYAVIQPDWPISGDRGSPNDNFVWSIVQNATSVIDEAARRGYIDRDRMAIGGHSYGAFGTANAMIHTSFFRAGIAGNGNYNRTLTPMGFQREPSDLWRGGERYIQMSPIFWAERLDGALLMYHGDEDQNVGTFPVNSDRMLHALNGIGKTAALYKYPHEPHGPSSEETLLDLWTRWANWLDHYVKNAGEPVPQTQLNEAVTD